MSVKSLLQSYQYGIYFADLKENSEGDEVNGYQPVVVLQNEIGNKNSRTTVVAPIITKVRKTNDSRAHVRIDDYKDFPSIQKNSFILCDQIRVIDKKRIVGNSIGYLSQSCQNKVKQVLKENLFRNHGYETDSIQRGHLYIADLGKGVGYEFKGLTPVVVLKLMNRMLITVPINLLLKHEKTPTHVLVKGEKTNLKRTGVILTEQIKSIDPGRLITKIDTLPFHVLKRIDAGIRKNLELT